MSDRASGVPETEVSDEHRQERALVHLAKALIQLEQVVGNMTRELSEKEAGQPLAEGEHKYASELGGVRLEIADALFTLMGKPIGHDRSGA